MADAAGQGFIAGLNDILMLGGVVSLVAALAALWLVRERDIERDAPIELPESQLTPEPQAARSRRLLEPGFTSTYSATAIAAVAGGRVVRG